MIAKPIAWLLREVRGNSTTIMCGKMFVREDAASAAAVRETNSWRTVWPIPVFAEPLPPVDPTPSWRCFHCDQVFADRRAAADHFGSNEGRSPACQIKASEGGLVRALRDAEDDCDRAYSRLHAESAEGLNAMRNNLSRHRAALELAEETGYDRGVSDMRDRVERLQRILHRYGERVGMAMCPFPDWQQEIDEALAWVADNPETKEADVIEGLLQKARAK